jgi:hypothetical protein
MINKVKEMFSDYKCVNKMVSYIICWLVLIFVIIPWISGLIWLAILLKPWYFLLCVISVIIYVSLVIRIFNMPLNNDEEG